MQDTKPLIDLSDNPYQKRFIFSPHKYTGYYGGVRNGKTYGGCIRGMMLSDKFPRNVGLIGRLTYPELRDTTQKEFLKFARMRNGGTLEEGPYIKSFNKNENILTLQNESIVFFRYLENPEAILSMTLGWFYVDQAEFIPETTYDILESRLSLWTPKSIPDWIKWHEEKFKARPKHKPKHFGFITGNPEPGWVHERYKLDQKGLYTLIEAPTEANIKNLPEEYLEDLKLRHTDEWIARYLTGSWDTFSGQIYKEYKKDLHVIPLMHIPDHWPRYLGFDHGQVHPTAVAFVAVDEEGNCIVYNEYHKVDPVIRNHAERILDLCDGDPVPRTPDGKGIVVWMDYAIKGDHDPEGRDFKQLYADLGIHGINANKRVLPGIQKVQLLLHPDPKHRFPSWHPRGEKRDKDGKVTKEAELGSPRLFIIGPRCPALLHTIVLYKWKVPPEGSKVKIAEEPEKYLDDILDALRYTVMAIFDKANPIEKSKEVTYDDWVLAEITGKNADLKEKAGLWD